MAESDDLACGQSDEMFALHGRKVSVTRRKALITPEGLITRGALITCPKGKHHSAQPRLLTAPRR